MAPQPSELKQRWDSVQKRLGNQGCGCAVLTTEQNFFYMTGLRFDALWPSAARSIACVVPVDGPLHLVVPRFLQASSTEGGPDAVVVTYDPPREQIDDVLVGLLKDMPPGPIGWEAGPESRIGLPLESADAVRAATEDQGSGDVSGLMWEIRMRKSAAEVAALTTAADAGSRAFEAVFAEGVVGRTEAEISRSLSRYALEYGAEKAHWVAATSGAGSYHRFVEAARDRVVETGDMFWADIGLTSNGYWTDFCRAAVAGPVSNERSELQRAIVEATNAGIERCRPGTPVAEVAGDVRERAAEMGVELLGYGRLGHGIGLSSTEPPHIAEWDPTVLKAGMVVTVEPALTHPSGLYCAEQVVHVTDDGPVVLTTATTELTGT